MKKILTILFLFVCVTTRAEDTTKVTVKSVYEDVKSGFTKLVDNLQGPAKHVYEIYVKQQQIAGWSYLGGCLLATILFLSLFLYTLKKATKLSQQNEHAYDAAVPYSVAAGFTGIGSVISLVCLIGFFGGDSFSQICNPEYWAIQDIIKAFK